MLWKKQVQIIIFKLKEGPPWARVPKVRRKVSFRVKSCVVERILFSLSESEKDSITQKLQNQISSITVESSIESLIKSKGFADCVVSIGEGRADITVMTENDALTADEVTRIRDAVLGKCKGLSAQDITVVEVR